MGSGLGRAKRISSSISTVSLQSEPMSSKELGYPDKMTEKQYFEEFTKIFMNFSPLSGLIEPITSENDNKYPYLLGLETQSDNGDSLVLMLTNFNNEFYFAIRKYKQVHKDLYFFLSKSKSSYLEGKSEKDKILSYISALKTVFYHKLYRVEKKDNKLFVIFIYKKSSIKQLKVSFEIEILLEVFKNVDHQKRNNEMVVKLFKNYENELNEKINNKVYNIEKHKMVEDCGKKINEKNKKIMELENEIKRLKGGGETISNITKNDKQNSSENIKEDNYEENDDEIDLKSIRKYFKDSFDVPVNVVSNILKSWRKKPEFVNELSKIDYIQTIIEKDTLYEIDITSIIQFEEDQETKKFIASHLVSKPNLKNMNLKIRAYAKAIKFAKTLYYGSSKKFQNITTCIPVDVNKILQNIDNFDFNVFEFLKTQSKKPLFYIALFLLDKYGLIQRFSLPLDILKKFLNKVEDSYLDNPYHNKYHAADVLQVVHYFLTYSKKIFHLLSDLDILGLIIAAISHDIGHRGKNNHFEIQTESDLSINHNDVSVLENMHCVNIFTLLKKPEFNFLKNCSKKQRSYLRRNIINMIVNTDASKHFQVISQVNASLIRKLRKKKVDSNILLSLLLKAADISNPIKPYFLCLEWAKRIMEEFFLQGDEEKNLDIPISAFMKRGCSIPKCQKSFIRYLCKPLYTVFVTFDPNFGFLLDNLEKHETFWDKLCEEEEKIGCVFDEDSIVGLEKEYENLIKEIDGDIKSTKPQKRVIISDHKGGLTSSKTVPNLKNAAILEMKSLGKNRFIVKK